MTEESLGDQHGGPDIWQNLTFAVGAGLLAAGIPSPVTALAATATWVIVAPCIRDPAIFYEASGAWADVNKTLNGEDGVNERLRALLDDVSRAWEGDAAEAFSSFMGDKFSANVATIAGAANSMSASADSVAGALLMANIGFITIAAGVTVACLIASASVDGGAIAKSVILSAYIPAAIAIVGAIVGIMVALGSQATSLESVITNAGSLFSATESSMDSATGAHADDLAIMGDPTAWDRTKTEEAG